MSQAVCLCSPLFHSVVASQWKPHYAISSPHGFLWLQNSNHSLTAPHSLSTPPPATFRFQSLSSGSAVCRSGGCLNPIHLSAGPNCSHQIGTECGHNEWFTGRCWRQDSSSFTPGFQKRLVFFLTFSCSSVRICVFVTVHRFMFVVYLFGIIILI